MTLPEDLPPRPANARGDLDRVKLRLEEHGCHLPLKDLRKLVGMAVADMLKATYATELRDGFDRSKTKTVKRDSFDDLLEVVMNPSDGRKARLEVLTVRAQGPSGRYVLLDISPKRTVIDVRGNPGDDDWAAGRAKRLHERLLQGKSSKICIRACAKLQSLVGAVTGGGAGFLACLLLLGHPLLWPVMVLSTSGGVMGVLGGIASAHRSRTIMMLVERITFGTWVKMPTFDQSLLILIGVIAIVVSIATFALTPDPQAAAPTTLVSNHAPPVRTPRK